MRHTAASLMIPTGEPVTWVAAQLGHSNPGVTLRTYAKLFDAKQQAEASRARMQAAYGSLLAVQPSVALGLAEEGVANAAPLPSA